MGVFSEGGEGGVCLVREGEVVFSAGGGRKKYVFSEGERRRVFGEGGGTEGFGEGRGGGCLVQEEGGGGGVC